MLEAINHLEAYLRRTEQATKVGRRTSTRSPCAANASHLRKRPRFLSFEGGVVDFSKFETFDNYCVAMFSFEYERTVYGTRADQSSHSVAPFSGRRCVRPDVTASGSK
jgi:hypothetical protein